MWSQSSVANCYLIHKIDNFEIKILTRFYTKYGQLLSRSLENITIKVGNKAMELHITSTTKTFHNGILNLKWITTSHNQLCLQKPRFWLSSNFQKFQQILKKFQIILALLLFSLIKLKVIAAYGRYTF